MFHFQVSSGESINSFRAKQRIKIPSRASSPSPVSSGSRNLVNNSVSPATNTNNGSGNTNTRAFNVTTTLSSTDRVHVTSTREETEQILATDTDHTDSSSLPPPSTVLAEENDDHQGTNLPQQDNESGIELDIPHQTTTASDEVPLHSSVASVDDLPDFPDISEEVPETQTAPTDLPTGGQDNMTPPPPLTPPRADNDQIIMRSEASLIMSVVSEDRRDADHIRQGSSISIKDAIQKFEQNK